MGTTCGHPLLVVYRAQSIVLHNLTLSAQKSTFPTALGVKVTGVDDSTFSLTGDAYSAICMPHADTHTSRILQEDDTSLGALWQIELLFLRLQPLTTVAHACAAYEFARKFPASFLAVEPPPLGIRPASCLHRVSFRSCFFVGIYG